MKKTKSMVMGAAILAALALPMVAGAANKLVVRNAGDTADAAVITDTGYVGVGTNAPAGPIHVLSSGNTIPSGGLTLSHTTTTASPKKFVSPNFTFYRNNDVTVNSGLPRLADTIGSLKYSAIGVSGIMATLDVRAEKNWTANDSPAYLVFEVNPGGGAANREAMRVSSQGTLSVNGGVQIYPYAAAISANVTLPAKPVCSSATQGTLWFTKVSGADTLQICADGTGGLGWRAMSISSSITP